MSAVLAGYDYPKMLYGPNGTTCTVSSAMEQEALGPEWSTSPDAEHVSALAMNSVRMDGPPQRLLVSAPPPAPVPAAPQPQAPPIDEEAIVERVALRVAEILAPMLPKRTGRPPNPEKESLDG